MNIYRGCPHGCIYCDSRSECYRNDDFDTVYAKQDALRIIRDDLRRKTRPGVVSTGAMSDPYNPFERTEQLTRHALELLAAYGFGVAYKPCVVRGRNHYGNLRIGASGGSDTKRFLGGIHLGYEHNYVLRSGWVFFWQVKGDVMIKGADLLRAGVGLGVKLPIR